MANVKLLIFEGTTTSTAEKKNARLIAQQIQSTLEQRDMKCEKYTVENKISETMKLNFI